MENRFNRKDLLEEVLSLIKTYNITAYEIEKNTVISAVGVQKIIDGTTKKPQQRTLLSIITYIKNKYEPDDNSQNDLKAYESIRSLPKTTLDKFKDITDDELSLYILKHKERILKNEVISFYIEKRASEIARESIAKEIKQILDKSKE